MRQVTEGHEMESEIKHSIDQKYWPAELGHAGSPDIESEVGRPAMA